MAGKPLQERKLWAAYQRAIASGKERKFLKNHPVFAKRAGANLPPKSKMGKLASNDAKVGQVVNAATQSFNKQNKAATSAQNVQSSSNPFGESGGYFDLATGRYVMYQNESDAQRAIRKGKEDLTTAGDAAAMDNLKNYSRFDFTGDPAIRENIFNATYEQLTKNVDRDQAQEFEAMEQRMYNRGIPLDPSNPAYKREMDALNEKYAAIKESAANQATIRGEEAYQAAFNRAHTQHAQGMSDTGAMQNYGMGYQLAPQLAFNASEYGQVDPSEVWLDKRGQDYQRQIAEKQIAANMATAKMAADASKYATDAHKSEEPPTG